MNFLYFSYISTEIFITGFSTYPVRFSVSFVGEMLYYGSRNCGAAYDSFACSRDLRNWTVWDGEPLVKSEHPFENGHAHKPWFIRYNGKNYHFYCAVNDQNERFIALAVSE